MALHTNHRRAIKHADWLNQSPRHQPIGTRQRNVQQLAVAEHEKEVDIDLPDVIFIGHKMSLVLPNSMLPNGPLNVCTVRNIAIAKAIRAARAHSASAICSKLIKPLDMVLLGLNAC
ncbi:hypothetical protein [Dyella sp. 2YAF14]|uniref:hypothetical protein n=1 Tax=Dyella sp. 2YAF14 TaxID=3233025 RepID=UPI003F8EFBA6